MRFIFLGHRYPPDLEPSASRFAAALGEEVAARKHEVHAIVAHAGNQCLSMELRRGVRVYRLRGDSSGTGPWSDRSSLNRAARARLRQLIHETNFATLVITYDPFYAPAAAGFDHVAWLHWPWAARGELATDATVGWLTRLRSRWLPGRLRRAEGQALSRANRVLLGSEWARRQLNRWFPGQRYLSQPQVLGGGVARRDLPERAKARARYSVADGDFILLCLHGEDADTGPTEAVQAFREVAAAAPQARLWLATAGEASAATGRLVEGSGLRERIRIFESVEGDARLEFGALADLALVPTDARRTFAIDTAEILGLGTPVLAPQDSARAELVAAVLPSGIYAPGPSALATALRTWLTRTRSEVERRAWLEATQRQFSWDAVMDRLEALWDELAVPPDIPPRR